MLADRVFEDVKIGNVLLIRCLLFDIAGVYSKWCSGMFVDMPEHYVMNSLSIQGMYVQVFISV